LQVNTSERRHPSHIPGGRAILAIGIALPTMKSGQLRVKLSNAAMRDTRFGCGEVTERRRQRRASFSNDLTLRNAQ